MDKRSPRSRRETLFILAAGVVGALLAALVMTWYLNRDNRWFRLVSPPGETPAQIVALDRKLEPLRAHPTRQSVPVQRPHVA